MFLKGYVYELGTKRVGIYRKSSTPFHTIMFPAEIFLDPDRYEEAFFGDHSHVRRKYPTQVLPDYRFCVLIHKRNFHSTFNSLATSESSMRRFDVHRFIDRDR